MREVGDEGEGVNLSDTGMRLVLDLVKRSRDGNVVLSFCLAPFSLLLHAFTLAGFLTL